MSKKSHILIVDDNPLNIQVLGSALHDKDRKITVTQNGDMALQAVQQHIPDLILLDVMMPKMDGFQVCQALKADPKTADIEIIFITAAVSDSDELKGLSLGAVDYIHKPFSIELVQSKVNLHLERARRKAELKLKNAALEEVVKLRDDIERITRHDLKTPLNAILGYSQLMQMDNTLTQENHEYLEEILRAGNEMLNMINSSLDVFKMETGRYRFTPEWVDIEVLIHNVIRDLKTLIQTQGISIDIAADTSAEHQAGHFSVLAEKSLSYSLFANLIRNAIEACSAGDRIEIDMKYADQYGVISIINPGSVPESIRNTFFEKYTTAGKTAGSGLGTYSAKLMAETQHGTIAMTTDSQQTCVTVRLPLNL